MYGEVRIYNNQTEINRETIYLVDETCFNVGLCEKECCYIIVGKDKPEIPLEIDADIIWYFGKESVEKVVDIIKNRIKQKMHFLVQSPDILWRIQQCTQIQQIGELAYEVLKNPVFIIGKNGHLLAFAPARNKEIIEDPALLSLACTGVDEIYDTPYQKFMQIWKGTREVFYSGVGSDGSVPGLHATMVFRNKFIGCMFAIGTEKAFETADEDKIQLLADAICVWMNSYPSYSQFHENNAFSCIEWLLEGRKLENNDVLRLWLNSLKWGKEDHYCVLRVECKQIGINRTELLLGRLFDCQMKPELGHILAICHIADARIFKERLKTLIDNLHGYGDAIGISSERIGVTRIPLCAQEAQQAVILGKKHRKGEFVFWFDKLYCYDLLENVKEHPHRESYCHPILYELIMYDRKYNTSYIDTLRCFVQNNMQHSATAQMLGIHRNTLNYRLGKIEGLCAIDLSSLDDLLRLRLSFYMQEMNVL